MVPEGLLPAAGTLHDFVWLASYSGVATSHAVKQVPLIVNADKAQRSAAEFT